VSVLSEVGGCHANGHRIIEHINKHEGVEWVTMEQMADDFKRNNKVPEGAKMPAPRGEILKLQKEGKAYSAFEYDGPMPE
jgi:hypothetical protein